MDKEFLMETSQIYVQKRPKPVSAYQELSRLLNAVKKNEMSVQEAMNLVQLREVPKPARPYCKVAEDGSVMLYGIKDQPIQMFGDEWENFMKTCKSGYMDNYLKYNEKRIKKSDMTPYVRSLFSEDDK